MSPVPTWIVTVSLAFHMAATVVWIGGLAFYSAILYPALSWGPALVENHDLLHQLRKRFQPLAWLSLGILIVTGLIQMSASPQYQGLLTLDSNWAIVLLLKHLAVLAMVILAAYQTWALQPRIERLWFQHSAGQEASSKEREASLRNQMRLISANTLLGLSVLALTALLQTA